MGIALHVVGVGFAFWHRELGAHRRRGSRAEVPSGGHAQEAKRWATCDVDAAAPAPPGCGLVLLSSSSVAWAGIAGFIGAPNASD